jgi:hypothetical protein
MSRAKVEFIDPRTAGAQPPPLKKPVFDANAVVRADETLRAMSGSFADWLEGDMQKLQTARLNAEQGGWTDAGLEALLAAAHDLKGMGATYGYPLATQLSASLCRLIETEAGKEAARARPSLVCAHVDALRASVRDGIKSSAHPVGRAILEALEREVDSLGVAPE